MNYNDYKKIAERYVVENKGTLDVLLTYNKDFEDKVYQYMLKLMLQYCEQNGKEIIDAMNTNKAYWRRFIEDSRK